MHRPRLHFTCSALLFAVAAVTSTPVYAARAPDRDRGRDRGHDRSRDRDRDREPKGPPSLALESFDLTVARAVVRVGGAAKAPDARLFVFHDDKDRHFVALYAACDDVAKPRSPAGQKVGQKVTDTSAPSTDSPPPAAQSPPSSPDPPPQQPPSPPARTHASDDGALRCELDLPRPYLHTHVVGLTLRLRGKEVAADEHIVTSRWAAAQRSGHVPSTPPAVPMTSVPAACDDPGFDSSPQPGDKTPNTTDEEEAAEIPGSDDPTAD